jgi:hypothetical protein
MLPSSQVCPRSMAMDSLCGMQTSHCVVDNTALDTKLSMQSSLTIPRLCAISALLPSLVLVWEASPPSHLLALCLLLCGRGVWTPVPSCLCSLSAFSCGSRGLDIVPRLALCLLLCVVRSGRASPPYLTFSSLPSLVCVGVWTRRSRHTSPSLCLLLCVVGSGRASHAIPHLLALCLLVCGKGSGRAGHTLTFSLSAFSCVGEVMAES